MGREREMRDGGERVGRGVPLRRWEWLTTLALPTAAGGVVILWMLLGQSLGIVLELLEGRSPWWVVVGHPLLALPALGAVGLAGLWTAFRAPRTRLRPWWARALVVAAILVGVGADLYLLVTVARYSLRPRAALAYWFVVLVPPLWAAGRALHGLARLPSLPDPDPT